jgi:phthalate 4,5-cis-dihydrodiol dehydrogenase
MARTLRFGVIGLGRAGAMMVSALGEHPDIKVTAAADLYSEHLSRFKEEFGGETYQDAEELCEKADVDVVYIATPHQFHMDHVLAATRQGKHVIVEKPMALTLEECDAMITAAEAANVKLIVGHTASFNPAILRMRELIVSGEVGQPAMISATAYTDFMYRPRRPEELVTKLGGGIMFNQIPHQVDAARYIAGGLTRSVRALTWVLDEKRPTEGCYMALLQFENGVGASLVYSGYDHFSSGELAGAPITRAADSVGATRRELGVRSPEDETALRISTGYGGERPRRGSNRPGNAADARGEESAASDAPRGNLTQGELGSFIVTCADADLRLTPRGVAGYTTQGLRHYGATPWRGSPGRGNLIDELYYAVTEGRPLVHDGRWAKATLEVCLAMLQSAGEGREVLLQHQVATVDLP